MVKLFGENIRDLKYYWLKELELDGIPLVVSRTGWSTELGYELFLRDGTQGDRLWEMIMTAGNEYGLQPGHTSSIRRIEGGMLSYHADADIHTNPFEMGLERLVSLDSDINFIGKKALIEIQKKGIKRQQIGLEIEGDSLTGPNTIFWEIFFDDKIIGKVTSAVFSPRLEKNIALAMVDKNFTKIGLKLSVKINGVLRDSIIVEKPFFDPKKALPSS